MTKSRGILAPRQLWTTDQVDQLSARYPHEKTESIAADMGRALSRCYQKAHSLGLKKSAAFLATPASGRTNGRQGIGTRFEKGSVSWNTGMKGLQHEASKPTQFKPGSTPANRLPVGHIRINSDGYQDIKTAPGKRQWVPLHRYNWKQAYGEYPARGLALIFKDGDRMHCDIGNLELISRSDLMKRNTVHNLPKELAILVQLTGALNRKINDKQRRSTK